jgi:hypothetical protein
MKKRNKKKNLMKAKLYLVLVIFLVSSLIFSSSYSKGEYDTFTNCLNKKGVVLYAVKNCPVCKLQKELFEDSTTQLRYIDCGLNKRLCTKEGITEYPSWKINGSIYLGDLPLMEIADLSGCNLVKDL